MTSEDHLTVDPVRDVPRHGVAGAVQRVIDLLNAVLATLSAIAIALAGFVLTWEVFGRHFWGFPSDWQDEFAVFLLVGATFGSAAWTQARRGHVGIEALAAVLPPRANRIRRRLADLVAAAFCGFFAVKSWQLMQEAVTDGSTTSSSWAPPLWIPYGAMAGGMALLTVQMLLQIWAAPSVQAERA